MCDSCGCTPSKEFVDVELCVVCGKPMDDCTCEEICLDCGKPEDECTC
jgi:hypothetical protein